MAFEAESCLGHLAENAGTRAAVLVDRIEMSKAFDSEISINREIESKPTKCLVLSACHLLHSSELQELIIVCNPIPVLSLSAKQAINN